MNLHNIHDPRIEEGVQMIRKRKIAKYYMKVQGFAKKEAHETAKNTQPEFAEARRLYLALFYEAKPVFADRSEKEKALRVYQVFSFLALICFVAWLFSNGYLNGSSVTDNFLLIALVINFAVTSYFDEKVTERIHERKTRELLRHKPEALNKLVQVEEIKRNIFRAEHRGIKLVEEQKEEAEKQPDAQEKIITLEKIKALRNKIKK
ncbi:hypothetical protein [Candidatus Enterococcus murrayae]|uniref:SMODS and SLOG-associating 2TM effector domain-containing protein n=1 Tax=Candidatus Enterococcus murrayae TaxID=2815321 RepID=A0ABS3HDE1_9ENTE|nr:hypothetical protein [Enterococcus sp. MJM16]MBO0450633.1 hypothetical protein [Enterococcus sp. MJM16]